MRNRCPHVVFDEPAVEQMIFTGRIAQYTLVERLPLSQSRFIVRVPCCLSPAACSPVVLFFSRQRIDVFDHERTRAFVREDFQQQAVGQLVRNDMHAFDAAVDRRLDRIGFRQHAVGQRAVLPQLLQARQIDIRNQRLRVIPVGQDARRARDQNEFLGIQRRRQRRSHGVRIDIQQRARFVGR